MEIKHAAIPAYGAMMLGASFKPQATMIKVGGCPRCRYRQLHGNSLYRYQTGDRGIPPTRFLEARRSETLLKFRVLFPPHIIGGQFHYSPQIPPLQFHACGYRWRCSKRVMSAYKVVNAELWRHPNTNNLRAFLVMVRGSRVPDSNPRPIHDPPPQKFGRP